MLVRADPRTMRVVSHAHGRSRHDLRAIAQRVMIEQGLEPDYPPAVLAEGDGIHGAAAPAAPLLDLRDRLWCSIDNDDSRDLDQLTVAAPVDGPVGAVKI